MLIIDGHNLIGRAPQLSLEDEGQGREAVLRRVAARKGGRGDGVAVVFDGNRPGTAKTDRFGGIRVIYAPRGYSADEEILRLVVASPRTSEVVTSDHGLADRVRELGAKVQSCEEFWSRLGKQGRGASADPEKPQRESAEQMERWLRLFSPTPEK